MEQAEREQRMVAGLIASLNREDLQVLIGFFSPEMKDKTPGVAVPPGSVNDIFYTKLSELGMAAEHDLTPPEDASEEMKAQIETSSAWALTDKGKQVIPQMIQVAHAHYPPPGAVITPEAVTILQMNIKKGDGQAMGKLGMLYEIGLGVEQSHEKAVEWYEKGAKIDSRMCINNLAVMHFTGRGVDKDLDRARELFEKAAEMGGLMAMEGLGVLYSDGVPDHETDHKKSAAWFRRAAEGGHSVSACNYALALENGLGVEEDPVEALKWYNFGVATGVEAKKERDALAARLTPEQVNEAERRMNAFIEDFKKKQAAG